MSVLDLLDPQSINPTGAPATAQSTDFMDVVSSSFDATMDNFRVNSESSLIEQQTLKRNKTFFERTGMDIHEAANQFLPSKDFKTASHQELTTAVDKVLEQMEMSDLPNSSGIVQLAEQEARDSLAKQQQAMAGADPSSQLIGGLAGSFGAMFFDPLNVATLPFGAGASRGLLKTVLLEAAVNSGVEAASQPAIADWQKQIGNKYGFPEMAENVGLAALFGASVPVAARGLKLSLDGAARVASSGMELFDDLKSKFSRVDLPEQAAAAEYMSRSAHIDMSKVSDLSEGVDFSVHERAMNEANTAIQEGRPPRIDIKEADVLKMNPERAEPAFRSTVERYVERVDQAATPPARMRESNPIFANEKPVPASVERQQEIEKLYQDEATIRNEAEEFDLLMKENTDIATEYAATADGKSLQSARRLSDYANDIKKDMDIISAIRTCSL